MGTMLDGYVDDSAKDEPQHQTGHVAFSRLVWLSSWGRNEGEDG